MNLSFSEILTVVVDYLWTAFSASFLQIFILLGPGIILALIMNLVSSVVEKNAYKIFGAKVFLYTFGWLGTSVHELGHAIFCVIFRHKITSIKLFSVDPVNGTLGHVNYAYDKNSLYQRIGRFFVGIGPIILGTGLIYCITILLLGEQIFSQSINSTANFYSISSFDSVVYLFGNVFSASLEIIPRIFSIENLLSWKFYLFLYLVFSIGSSITLSPVDIRGALSGFMTMLFTIFCFNLVLDITRDPLTAYFVSSEIIPTSIYYIVVFVILLHIVVASILLFMSKVISLVKN